MERANFRTAAPTRSNQRTAVMDVARPSRQPAVTPISPAPAVPPAAPAPPEMVALPSTDQLAVPPDDPSQKAVSETPAAPQAVPKKDKAPSKNTGVGAAIFTAVLVVLALAALAVLAYMKGATA